MRLTLFSALALALVSSILPACNRTATDKEEAASKGGTSGKAPQGAATGQPSEGSAK